MMKSKIAVVGLGGVGRAVSLSIVNKGVCNELVLINRTYQKAQGYALDLMHSLEFMPRNMHIHAGDYKDCADADIVILAISGGVPCFDRNKELEASCKAIKSVVCDIMASGFNGIFLVITNPVDTIVEYIRRITGLTSDHILGTGTCLDSARLKFYLAHLFSVSPKDINAFVLGEHGMSAFIPWSCINIMGKPITSIIESDPSRFPENFNDYMLNKMLNGANKVYEAFGSTSCGVASAAVAIAEAILYDENRVMTVCTSCKGYYGITDDISIGLPAIVGANGVREVIQLALSDSEKQNLVNTIEVVRKSCIMSKEFE